MSEIDDCVRCVSRGESTWCGRNSVFEFTFIDWDHAVQNAEQGGRMMVCSDCWKAVSTLIWGR